MKKIFIIALKDLRITYRDFTALIIMIAAPLAMTLVMSFAFGSSGADFSQIPIGVVNNDNGMMSEIIINALTSDEVNQYLITTEYNSIEKAMTDLENDKLGAVVSIPEGMSALIDNQTYKETTPNQSPAAALDLYPNLTRPISVQIVNSILEAILADLNAGFAAGSLGFSELLEQGAVTTNELSNGLGESIGQKLEPLFTANAASIQLETTYLENENDEFSWLAYMSPSMAILYLSFSMNNSARSILSEREKGTLPRLLVCPHPPEVTLVGKIFGTFFIGITQVFIFILISRFLLNIHWGGILQVMIFTVLIVFAVASWGILVASLARNSGEASAISTAITLLFAVLAGNFIPRGNFPGWLKTIGYLTPNAWGIEGYLKMIQGANFVEMLPAMSVLLGMTIVILFIAGIAFKRQYHRQNKMKVHP